MPASLLLPSESAAQTLPGAAAGTGRSAQQKVAQRSYRYIDRGGEHAVDFPVDPKADISGVIPSASFGALRDYQDKLKVIHMRERGLSKAEIAEKVGRSENWVKRWWREHPAALERPTRRNDVVLQKASLHSFRDLDIRRSFHDDSSTFDKLVKHMTWRQAKVVARDPNTGELGLRFDERGRSIYAGRQVADYSGGLDFLDRLLQKVFSQMDIRDPKARIFMNYYADGKEKTGVHRHDFWTCLMSFGAPRILTVDNRPILMRDQDLIMFGTQSHGVPIMPDVNGGRISLVIFFYPDADNLERQWQTIAEEEDSTEANHTDNVGFVQRGVDQGFNATMLWGDSISKNEQDWSNTVTETNASENSAVRQAIDPSTSRRALLKSPNSELLFDGVQETSSESTLIFSVACEEAASNPVHAEKELFEQLQSQGVQALWDFRARPLKGCWCEPEALRRICASRATKYRYYPLGRKEAGGAIEHVASEEGRDILGRLLRNAQQEGTAFLTTDANWRTLGLLRATVASSLVGGDHGNGVRVLHMSTSAVEEHPRPPRGQSRLEIGLSGYPRLAMDREEGDSATLASKVISDDSTSNPRTPAQPVGAQPAGAPQFATCHPADSECCSGPSGPLLDNAVTNQTEQPYRGSRCLIDASDVRISGGGHGTLEHVLVDPHALPKRANRWSRRSAKPET